MNGPGIPQRHELQVALGERAYPIVIGADLLDDGALLAGCARGEQALVVTNTTLAPLYLARVQAALAPRLQTGTLVLPDGEAHKNLEAFATIQDGLIRNRHDRRTLVVALGGGVVGDLAGFAAACYQRGVDFIQVPTTLLAQVDSSVGGKTAVNHPAAKNMIGAFHQPRAVYADMTTLATLPLREFRSGLAEVLKYGVIADAGFFAWLEDNVDALLAREPAALVHAVARSCATKAAIVVEDEHETGVRAHLNFGHTFGHAIEARAGYGQWLHGEAVAAGMVMAADLSARTGRIGRGDAARVRTLVERFGLPSLPPQLPASAWRETMSMDKKVASGRIRFVLMRGIGAVEVSADVAADALDATLAAGLMLCR